MSIPTTAVWQVWAGGSDLNGGFFNAARGGTDYSRAVTPILVVADFSADGITAFGNDPAGGFTAQMVGNGIQFNGTIYEIVAFNSSTSVTLDRIPPNTNTVANVGGACATPGFVGGFMTAGNKTYLQAGTTTVTSATSNVAGGCMTLPAAANGANATKLIGFTVTPGDGAPTRPVIKANGVITSFTLLTMAANTRVEGIEFDGNTLNRTTTKDCYATGCSVASAFIDGFYHDCVAYLNSAPGFFSSGGMATFSRCLSLSNSGASTDGFNLGALGQCLNCLSYGNGRNGFFLSTSSTPALLVGCVAVNNAGYGYRGNSAVADNTYLYNCAGYNNTSGNVNSAEIPAANNIGFITLTADPFVNAAGLNFALNTTSGGGALVRAILTTLPGLSTVDALDGGPAQHVEVVPTPNAIRIDELDVAIEERNTPV